MILLYLLGGCFVIGVVWPISLAVEIFSNRHPLTTDEIRRLAHNRRYRRALVNYQFSTMQRPADPSQKKAMQAAGEFVTCDFHFHEAPSRIAGLLKYKKHEWIVFAFINQKKVCRLWWNKGPDGTKVWSELEDHALEHTLRTLKADTLAIFHNHPSRRYMISANADMLTRLIARTLGDVMHIPSSADIESAGTIYNQFEATGIAMLEFICVRGVPHLYYAAFPKHIVPAEGVIAEVSGQNGKGIFSNHRLRKELRTSTEIDWIHTPSSNVPPVIPPPSPPNSP
jgi:hypothetical protein